jgi:sulfate transport system ATP-binding protein
MNAFGTVPLDLRQGVSLRGIEASFDAVPAVRGIDLDVRQGEFLALVGPSGAGKTTLLRIIAGLQPGHAGSVVIGGRDVTSLAARERNIGFAFQNYALFGHMTVAQNVAFGLRVRPRATRPDRQTIARRVTELLQLVHVAPLADRRPGQLSGGQRQRVALARALATEPALLLLDEPFGALDALVRKEIRTWLRQLHDRLGLTSILVTHDQAEAIEVADRIAVLRDGRLQQLGTPDELEDRPANHFVHRFLGECVTFQGSAGDGAVTLDIHPGHPIAIPTHGLVGRVIASIRPWQIALAHGDEPIAGDIVHIHRAGAHLRIAIRLADRTIEALISAGAHGFARGERVTLDLRAAHIFRDSEHR